MKHILCLWNKNCNHLHVRDDGHSVSLLLLRVGAGGLILFTHGLPKLFNVVTKWNVFPDPLGLGSGVTILIAIFAEVLCATAIILGWKTRWAAVPLISTMLVAALIVNHGQAWADQELPLMYALPFCALMISGSGRYSLEYSLRRDRNPDRSADEIGQKRSERSDGQHAKSA